MKFLTGPRLLFSFGFILASVDAWQNCSVDSGGGVCPDRATCCKSAYGSSCIPARAHDPDSSAVCCDEETGCGYGYQCAVEKDSGKTYCKLKPEHPSGATSETNRYKLCHVPDDLQDLMGFPIQNRQMAYYSNMGAITEASTAHLHVEKVLIMVHGSIRNAADYFCAALSMLGEVNNMNSTLVIAPLFAAPEDGPLINGGMLVWADRGDKYPVGHTWRYGADALNAPVSSYGILDAFVEHLAFSRVQFPNLSRIAVAGHSAGGQAVHRWALLSNSLAWTSHAVKVASIAANPRSYCYLDGRRFQRDGSFDIPDIDDISICPGYSKWQWGLDEGGLLECPYKDEALKETPVREMTERYATRNVTYLSGELDTLPAHDRCETNIFQGKNRQERAKNYFRGLKEFFGREVHDFHIVAGSPHDHSLMFQSEVGSRVVFG